MTNVKTKEGRIFGPPGCGKTTAISRMARDAAAKYGPTGVMLCSLTRTAAKEIAGRDIPIAPEMVGTLHSHCFHALGRPELMAKPKAIRQWNTEYPHYELSGGHGRQSIDDPLDRVASDCDGDGLLEKIGTLRAQQIPSDLWSMEEQDFHNKWTRFKYETSRRDFTDLIEDALQVIDYAPNAPNVIMVDEAQDCSKLELALVRKWGNAAEHLILVGDDEQAIFAWRGATPDAFLQPPVAPERKRILSQSYRVPRAVHKYAVAWSAQIEQREEKVYLPRDCDGKLIELGLNGPSFLDPEDLVELIDQVIKEGRTVMVLGTCGYHLYQTVKLLKSRAIPFANKYRPVHGQWNPLRFDSEVTSPVSRLLAYRNLPYREDIPHWSHYRLRQWTDLLDSKSGVLVRGAKTEIKRRAKGDPDGFPTEAQLNSWFGGSVPDRVWVSDTEWLRDHMLQSKRSVLDYPASVLEAHGVKGLLEPPQVTVGTIHSVKGGEADCVALFPDLSPAGYEEWHGGPDARDSVRRVFYVGMTRARESLYLCAPASERCVPL